MIVSFHPFLHTTVWVGVYHLSFNGGLPCSEHPPKKKRKKVLANRLTAACQGPR